MVLVDYATQCPEAVPLQAGTAPCIAEELRKWIARMGMPKEILTHQVQNFMSEVLRVVCRTLQIKHLRISVYHPQTNCLMERLKRTIKWILRHCIQGDPRKWDLLLPLVLFTIRDAPQDTTKYFPFELVLGHRPRGLLQVLREKWERDAGHTQEPCVPTEGTSGTGPGARKYVGSAGPPEGEI